MTYDVIVVGAGPSGTTAARLLARNGLKTLLLEKEKIPRYKPCGGGVTAKVRDILDVDFSPTVEDTIKQISFAYGKERLFPDGVTGTVGWSVMRDRFDALLADQAVKAGAELRDNCSVKSVEVDANGVVVRTTRQDLRASVVVGADGANGIVARGADLYSPQTRRLVAALEAEMDLPSDSVEAWRGVWHLDFAAIKWGYGWIFPKAEHLSVGVGSFLKGGERLNLREVLNHYIESEPTLRSHKHMSLRGHLIPVGGRRARLNTNRVVLVGDAAGLPDPFSGEGIYAAIKSGIIASEEVQHAFAAGNLALDNYSRRIHAAFTEDYRYAWLLSNVYYRAPQVFYRVFANSVALQTAASEMGESHFSYKKTFYRGLKSPVRLYSLFRKAFV